MFYRRSFTLDIVGSKKFQNAINFTPENSVLFIGKINLKSRIQLREKKL